MALGIFQPFRWYPDSFSCLGIKVSPCLKYLYKLNFTLLPTMTLIDGVACPHLFYAISIWSKWTFSCISCISFKCSQLYCHGKFLHSLTVLLYHLSGVKETQAKIQFSYRLHNFHYINWPHSISSWLSCESASLDGIPLLYISPEKVVIDKWQFGLKDYINRQVRTLEGYNNCFL